MLRTIIKKEFQDALRDGKYLTYAVVCILLITGSFIVNSSVYRVKMDNYRSLAGELGTDPDELNNGYWSFSWSGVHEILAPVKMQMLCSGIEKEYYKYIHLNVQQVLPLLKKESIDYPEERFFLWLDVPLVVTLVLSLLVFIFAYGSVAREREEGTLRLLLSYPVPRVYVILAKLAAGYAGVLVPVVFSFICVLLIAGLDPGLRFSTAETATAAALFALVAVYLLVMYSLGMLVSARCRRSVTAITVLVMTWLVFMVVLHNAALLAMDRKFVRPSIAAMNTEFETRLAAAQKAMDELSEQRFGTAQYWRLPPERITPDQMADLVLFSLRGKQEAAADILLAYVRHLENAVGTLRWWSFLSPGLVLQNAAARLCNTGVDGRMDTYRTVVRSQEEFMAFIERNIRQLAREGKYYGDKTHTVPVEELKRIRQAAPPLADRLQGALPELAALVVLCLVFMVGAMYSFIRTDVS